MRGSILAILAVPAILAMLSVDLNFYLVAVRITDKCRKPLACRSAIDLSLGGFQAFPFQRGNHIVDTGPGGPQAEMLFAQVGGRCRVDGCSLKQIQNSISRAQRDNLISRLRLSFTLYRKAQAFVVKLLHRRQVFGDQGDVVEAFIGKHYSILSLSSRRHKSFLCCETHPATKGPSSNRKAAGETPHSSGAFAISRLPSYQQLAAFMNCALGAATQLNAENVSKNRFDPQLVPSFRSVHSVHFVHAVHFFLPRGSISFTCPRCCRPSAYIDRGLNAEC